jgi:hypothetical protein
LNIFILNVQTIDAIFYANYKTNKHDNQSMSILGSISAKFEDEKSIGELHSPPFHLQLLFSSPSPFYSMLFLTFNLNFLGKYCQHRCTVQQHNKMQIKKKTLEIYRSKSAVVSVESWKNKAIKAEFIIWIQ